LIFGVSLGVLAGLAVVRLDGARGSIQRGLDAVTGALAVWSVVASVVYDGTLLTWLSFREASGFVALGVAGLIAHELKTEGIVHAFEAIPPASVRRIGRTFRRPSEAGARERSGGPPVSAAARAPAR
jgi:hypothetical protein